MALKITAQGPVPNPGQPQGTRVPKTHQTTTKQGKPGTGPDLWNAGPDLHAAILQKHPRNSSRSRPAKVRSRLAFEFCPTLVFSPSKPRFFTTQMIPKVSTHQITHFGRKACTQNTLNLKESSTQKLEKIHGECSPWIALDLCWREKRFYRLDPLQMAFKNPRTEREGEGFVWSKNVTPYFLRAVTKWVYVPYAR